jgi:hypothetical protein
MFLRTQESRNLSDFCVVLFLLMAFAVRRTEGIAKSPELPESTELERQGKGKFGVPRGII